ncbi:hypothetical protein B1748_10850 [Paenibacillus sp. MY03]|uniref:TIR domain-containing protein n=1 Tax=Paenibacillus sp. MY03 TaxID=302980 RepID=UPI000B3CA0AF|nr:TIR domain-containing protein [Paenibacillus sp. MY03]OUS76590.1 hypothetical protein B1748_10850 [Paenibacillus sp. MY03]
MQYTVFFSWQADLPNNKNRSFIESCLLKSIENLKKDVNYTLELNIDRDTQSTLGTPDITESIFKKIDQCSFFIADVSIINGTSRKYKKTPNPNVLIELGYAAKKLGWEKVICVFNSEFGKINDLPFDLRNRRILTYEFNPDNKPEVKKNIERTFHGALIENYKRTVFANELLDYFNSDIYLSLFGLIVDFSKMMFGYENNNSSIENIKQVLNMTDSEVEESLTRSIFIGFQLFKSYDECINKLSKQLEKIVSLRNFDDDYYVPLVRLITILRIYDKELNRRGDISRLNSLQQVNNNYRVIPKNQSKELSNRIILLKLIDNDKGEGVVVDFGDIHRKDHIENLTHEFTLTPESLRFYKGFVIETLTEINAWIDNNHGEFFIDNSRLEISLREHAPNQASINKT